MWFFFICIKFNEGLNIRTIFPAFNNASGNAKTAKPEVCQLASYRWKWSPTLSASSVDWYPDESTTSPHPACAGVGLLGVVASVVEEDLGRLACCCGSWVLRRCSAWGLPLGRGSRSPPPGPELAPLARRLWRLLPRFIAPAAAERRPAAGGATGAERQSESRQHGPKGSLEPEGEVPPADTTEEDEEEAEEGALERERRLRCWWKSCFSPCPNTFMFSLQLR